MMIGNRIKQLRKQKKLTQHELAMAVGLDRTTITRYETGGTKITAEILPKIADALNVPIAKLFEL